MCGIAGLVGEIPSAHVLERMQQTMRRRGPDQDGIWIGEDAAMLHDRLAVIDIEGGRQPMLRRKGEQEFVMVYNGELYNTQELRKQLCALGYTFFTHSDTEVVLTAYLEWGEACLDALNGIYAFSVWDIHKKSLFFARDRIGVKPFFFTHKNDSFLFASEIKTLLAHPDVHAEIDKESICELMLIGPGRTPGYGVFCNIQELPAGWCGTYSPVDGIRLQQYWKLEDREHTDNTEQTVAHVRELVVDAIRRQLVSDVPLCTFLSGGLDSSIISAVAAKEYAAQGKQLDTVSVTYRDNAKYFKKSHFQPNSDDAFISKMNDAIGAKNHLVVIDTPQLVQALFEAVEARDLPGMADVDASLLLFCREIKNISTVALSGECADEIFGGYPWYRDADIRRKAGFPWAQSTEYRASFLREEWQQQIDAAAYVDEKYRQTIAQVTPEGVHSENDRRIREMTRLNFGWFMQTLLDEKVTETLALPNNFNRLVIADNHTVNEHTSNVAFAVVIQLFEIHEQQTLRDAVFGFVLCYLCCDAFVFSIQLF